MACASRSPHLNDRPLGWTCTGEGLIRVMTINQRGVPGGVLPVVVPVDRLSEVPPYVFDGEPQPYANTGDHAHLILGIAAV
jgi:hypothetical protein